MKNKKFDYDLLLINPPILTREPGFGSVGTVFVPDSIKVTAMNPGILSIASYLKAKGFNFKIIDLSVDNDYGKLASDLKKSKPMVAGVSSQCGFDYLEALKCLEIIKNVSPETLTIAGGQHVGPLGKIVFTDSPNLDVLVKYEGEIITEEIIGRQKKHQSFGGIPGIWFKDNNNLIENKGYPRLVDLNELPPLNYEIYPDFLKFTPFIEESRGCCFNCSFCTSNFCNQGKIRIKNSKNFLAELEKLFGLYGKDRFYAVLASTFGFNVKNTQEIAKGIKKFGFNWTTEIRLDLNWEKYLNDLCEGGLSVLTVGMESASPQILLQMNKTKTPLAYLKKAEKLVQFATSHKNLSLRFNYIFYVGESPKTLRETMGFLLRNKQGIDSVLYSLILLTKETPLEKNFRYFEEKYGSSIYHSDYWDRIHIHPCQPSKYFSVEEASYFCSAMEKIFSSEEGWYKAEMAHYSQETKEEIKKVKKALIKSRFLK